MSPSQLFSKPDNALPNAKLTPGAERTTDTALVCSPGYATRIRPQGLLWRRLKDEAYNRYHIPRGQRSTTDANGRRYPAYEIDHLIPLELGGDPTDIRNLWPESIALAKQKDQLENRLHSAVCSGTLSLSEAQTLISTDWLAALSKSQ
jgi:hypothetical protein